MRRRNKPYDGRYFWEKASKVQLLGCIADLETRQREHGQLSQSGELMLRNCKKALKSRHGESRMENKRSKATLGKNQRRFLLWIRQHGSYQKDMAKGPFACWSYLYQVLGSCLDAGLIAKQTWDDREVYILTMQGSDLLNLYVGTPTE